MNANVEWVITMEDQKYLGGEKKRGEEKRN